MITDTTAADAPPQPGHWGLAGTLLWGIGIAFSFVVVQSLAMLIYLTRGKASLGDEHLEGLIETSQDNGVIISIATLVTTLVCVPLVLGVAKLKRGSNLADYLAVKSVPHMTLGVWLAITALFIALSDSLTVLLGRPVVPEIMASAYASADPVWLLWLAFVVGAPLFEETFFRGFLFKGLQASIKPIGAIVLTAALWAGIHIQYDAYGIGTVFVLGLLLGVARSRTNSIFPPLAMHALANIVACSEAALWGRDVIV